MQFFGIKLAIAKDLGKKSRTDGLARVHRHYGGSSIPVPEKMVAAFNPHQLEPSHF